MADQAFINSLAAAFAKEFAGSADPALNKKIKDIRDEIAKAIGNINPGQLSTAFSGNVDISSLLTPSVSNEANKKSIRLRQDYDRLTKVLLNRVNTYVARTSKLLTGTIEIGSTVREILGGNKKMGLLTSIKYNSVARKLLDGIGNYVDKFSKTGNIATGKLRFENAVANILNVDNEYSFWTKSRYNRLARKLLEQIGEYVDKKGAKLFTGKVEATDAITSLLSVDKNWGFWTRRTYNKLTRKLLKVIDTFVTNNADNLIKGKLKVEDIIPSLLGGDVQSSWSTRRKFNAVRRNLLNKINDYVENGLQFKTDPVDALGLLDIHAGSLGDRKQLHDIKIKLHESFFKVTDKFITRSLSFVTPPQDVMNLLNIHATGFIDRAGIKQGFKQSVKAFFDRLKDHITNAKIKFKSEFKFDPLELVTISDTDKANLQRRYLTAVERYMHRIVQKLEKGVINLQALELPDNLGEDIAKAIANKIKKGTITIGSINLQQPVGAAPVPQVLPPAFGTEEKIFEDRVTKTMIVDSNSRAIDFEKIFCGCVGKLGDKLDKMIAAFKMGASSNTAGESNESSSIAQIIAAIAGSKLVTGAKEKVGKFAKTAKEKVGNVAKAIKQKAGSAYNTAKSGLSWVGSKIGGALSSVGKGLTRVKDAVVNSLSAAKKALFGKLSSFAGGAKGYLKYVFKLPVINTIFTAFFASAEIQEIIANSQLTAAQKEQAIGVVVIKSLGTLLGGAAGAALLTAIPGGTILGGVLGSMAGAYIAEWIGNNIDARALGRLIIDVFGLNLGVTKETESAVDQRLGQAAEISTAAGSTASAVVSPTTQVPKISNDYSPNIASSSKTAVSAIKSTKASDPIKQLNNTVQNLNKSIAQTTQSSLGTPSIPKGRMGNTGASKAFNGGGFREPAYNVRISAWSRLRPGSIMS